jgi:hypothetical protein
MAAAATTTQQLGPTSNVFHRAAAEAPITGLEGSNQRQGIWTTSMKAPED